MSLVCLIACSKESEPRVVELEKIHMLEDTLHAASGELDPKLAMQMISAYDTFAFHFPADSLTPYMLFKSAEVNRNTPRRGLYAIQNYIRIHNEFPDHVLAAPAAFMIGLTYDEVIGNKERAVKAYTEFIDLYPDSPLREQAESMRLMATEGDDLSTIHKWLNQSDTIKE